MNPAKKGSKRFIIVVCAAAMGLAAVIWGLHFMKPEPGPASSGSTAKVNKDIVAPTIHLTDETVIANKSLTGIITVTVDAHDNVAVSKVEYYIDGAFWTVTYAPPFSLTLDTSKLAAGPHVLLAKVFDEAGNTAHTQDISFTIAAQVTSAPVKAATKSLSNLLTSSSNALVPVTDTTAPSTPTNVMLTADGPYVTTVTWTASTDNVGISNYKIYRDGALLGTATNPTYTDYTVVPGNTYSYSVTAYDAAGNHTGSLEPSITLQSSSIWMNFDRPAAFANDGTPIELGVKFRPLVNGKVSGIRFYKASGDTGTHVGTLWSSGGSSLATATFSGETASGWQQVTFATPVDVTAGTTYVASYLTPQGKYGATTSYFASAGITSQYLRALASGVDGNNGVFNASGAGFPSSSFSNANYWVDVSFIPGPSAGGPSVTLADATQLFNGFPGSNNTGVVGKRLPVRDRQPDIVAAGMVVENAEIRVPDVYVPFNNTVFRNVKIVYTGALDAGFTVVNIQSGTTGTTFEDCEIDGQDKIERTIKGNDDVTVTRCNIHNTGNAVEASDNITVEDSYLHDLFTPSGLSWHSDGVQSASAGSDITIRHNTIFLTGAETGAVNVQGTALDTFTNVLIENNLMAGGSYTVYAGAGTNVNYQILNNKFSTRYHPKVGDFNIYYPNWLAGITIMGNTIYETGASADVNL